MPQNPSCYLQIHFLIVAFHRLFKIFYSVLHFFVIKYKKTPIKISQSPLVTSSYFLFYLTNSPKGKDIQFSKMHKQQILLFYKQSTADDFV